MAEGTCDAAAVLLLYDTGVAITTGRGGDPDLGVAIVRIAPAPALKQAMRSGDLSQRRATGQMTARVNLAASELTHV